MNKTYNSENTEYLKNVVKELLKEEVSNLDVITNELLMYAIGDSYNMKTVLNKTRALAIPKEFEKANRLEYLNSMHGIISTNTINTYFYREVFPHLSSNNIKSDLYTLMKVVKYNGENRFNDFIGNLGIVSLIISYIYENGINDYTILNNFLNDPEYYYQKMSLSGITFYESELHEFYLFDYNSIYNNIEYLFNNKKDKIIK